MFEKVVLIIGGNRGDRKTLLQTAVKSISELGELTVVSKIYETEAWGGVAKGAFLNQIVELETSLSPIELLAHIQQIETKLGRKRNEHWGDRTMDIDIIYFGDNIIDTPELQVPHPFIAERRFVLVPLAEISPEFVHPISRKSSLELLEACRDRSDVREWGGLV